MSCTLVVVCLVLSSRMDVFPPFQAIESAQRQGLKSHKHEIHTLHFRLRNYDVNNVYQRMRNRCFQGSEQSYHESINR
jgi:hypothetical protein